MLTGIYKITNKINGHLYIGQSIDIENRWTRHKWSAFNEEATKNYPLYRAFRKYGLENFTFEIIELCDKEGLKEKEIYYIQMYDSFVEGYNQTSGGDGCYGQEKPVYQYDLDGNFVAVYASVAEAARCLNVQKQLIYKACWKQLKTAAGFQWRNDPTDIPVKTTFGQGKRIYQYDLDGNYIRDFPSIIAASKELNVDYNSFKKVLRGSQKTAGGFQWSLEKTDKLPPTTTGRGQRICQYDKSGTFMKEYPSAAEASRQTGVGSSNITSVLRGKTKTAGGFIWKRKE